MRQRKISSMSRAILLGCLMVLVAQVASGQTNKPSDDRETLQALLAEVKSLRQALQTLQEMSLDTYRSQLLFDRIRVGREEIQRLNASLNETRQTLDKTQATIPTFSERLKMLESHAQMEVDQKRKADFEFEVNQHKQMLERYKASIEPLKQREQQLATELQTEKSKLEELESRLDRLEQAIESDRLKLRDDKTAATKNPEQ